MSQKSILYNAIKKQLFVMLLFVVRSNVYSTTYNKNSNSDNHAHQPYCNNPICKVKQLHDKELLAASIIVSENKPSGQLKHNVYRWEEFIRSKFPHGGRNGDSAGASASLLPGN